jgi:uncharacterized membrane protein YdjX (TVP38/TMEM64 family)
MTGEFIAQVLSGALYGFWAGLAVSWLATNIGQCAAFLLGRYLFRPTVKVKAVQHNK